MLVTAPLLGLAMVRHHLKPKHILWHPTVLTTSASAAFAVIMIFKVCYGVK